MTSTREKAFASLFALISGSTVFKTRARNANFALNQLDYEFPAVVMAEGGDSGLQLEHTSLTTNCTAYFQLSVRGTSPDAQLGTLINEARHELLTLLATWKDHLPQQNIVTAVRYGSTSDLDIDEDGGPTASVVIEINMLMQEREFENLSL